MRDRFHQAAVMLFVAALFAALVMKGILPDLGIFLVVALAYAAGYRMGGD